VEACPESVNADLSEYEHYSMPYIVLDRNSVDRIFFVTKDERVFEVEPVIVKGKNGKMVIELQIVIEREALPHETK